MLNSMTGFGRGTCKRDGREITIEIRSVNHKFLDLSFRMPRSLNFLEDTLRTQISGRISRGHLDVVVSYTNSRDDTKVLEIDEALAAQYISVASSLAEKYSLKDEFTAQRLMNMTDVLIMTEKEDDAEAINEIAAEAVNMALSALLEMREREGMHLFNDINKKLDNLSRIRDEIEKSAERVEIEHKEKLSERIAALMPKDVVVDAQRLSTEIAILADKSSIDEEMVRIKTHIANMRVMLEEEEPVGRKIDFLVQELNREFNTTGSKSSDVGIAQNVIAGKAEIEKIREQIQNIE